MKKTIIDFIVLSITQWSNDFKLGEEIRATQETIENIMDTDPDDIIGVILLLLYLYPNDEDLGRQIRKHLTPFKLYLQDDKTEIN